MFNYNLNVKLTKLSAVLKELYLTQFKFYIVNFMNQI